MQARFSQFSFFSFLMLNEWRTFARATGAPLLAFRAQILIRPVESQDPGVLKKSRSYVNRRRRNKRFWA